FSIALHHQTDAHPGLEFLELFLSTLHGQILSLIQTVLQHFWPPELNHQLHFGPEQVPESAEARHAHWHPPALAQPLYVLSLFVPEQLSALQSQIASGCFCAPPWPPAPSCHLGLSRHHQAYKAEENLYLELCLNVPELFLGLSSLAIGMAQLNLHLIKISLHLLLDSQGIISAPDLRVQSALHGFNDSLAVPLDLLHLLILLCKLPVDLTLNLVKLKLDSKNLGLLMLQVPLCAGWHQFHIWSSTEQLHCWPLTFLSGAQPLPPALPQTAPGAGRSRDGLIAHRGPLLLDTLQVVDLLSQLSHTVGLLLAQSCSGSFMLESGLFKITAQLLEFSFTLLVHLNLSCSGSTGLLKPLTDLLKFPGEISSLLLNLSTSCTLSLNLFLQFLNASLELLLVIFQGVDFIFLSLEIIKSLLGELQIINVFLQLRALILQFPLLSCELSIDFFLILQSLSCLFELSLELDFALDQTLTPLLSI
ncbi:hypothetical protein DNTS_000604, partial [Danionella cerebrum]